MKTILSFIIPFLFFHSMLAQPNTSNYFPLKVGYQWTYKLPTEDSANNGEEVVTVADYDNQYNAYLVRGVTKMGNLLPITDDKLIEVRKTKILQLGLRSSFSSDWKFKSNLLLQYPLKKNTKWKQGDESETEYTVIGFVTLKVEAGTFNNVCKIKKLIKSFDKTYYLYFAPEIGLIKVEMITNNSIWTWEELTSYKLN